MFSNRFFSIFLSLSVLLIISACSGYEKLLKSTDYQLKYSKAIEYYEAGEYVRAGNLFDQIVTVYRGTTKADTVYNYQAMCYFKQRDYILAGHHFTNLADNYPNSAFAEDAQFTAAYCSYMLSPKYSLDQANTRKAIDQFTLFVIRNPGSERIVEAKQYIDEMKNKLIKKSYENGRLYYDLGDYKASIIALENSLNEYPDTEHREELMFLLLESHYLLAENSIPEKQAERYQNTIDAYYSFTGEFPESRYQKEASRLYQEALTAIGQEDYLSQE
jgi:outer membrane protein assembly factor BamD